MHHFAMHLVGHANGAFTHIVSMYKFPTKKLLVDTIEPLTKPQVASPKKEKENETRTPAKIFER